MSEPHCIVCQVSRRILGLPCQLHASSMELQTIEAMKHRALAAMGRDNPGVVAFLRAFGHG